MKEVPIKKTFGKISPARFSRTHMQQNPSRPLCRLAGPNSWCDCLETLVVIEMCDSLVLLNLALTNSWCFFLDGFPRSAHRLPQGCLNTFPRRDLGVGALKGSRF